MIIKYKGKLFKEIGSGKTRKSFADGGKVANARAVKPLLKKATLADAYGDDNIGAFDMTIEGIDTQRYLRAIEQVINDAIIEARNGGYEPNEVYRVIDDAVADFVKNTSIMNF